MKKYSFILLVLTLILLASIAFAQDLSGTIRNAEVNTVAVATANRQFSVPVIDGRFRLEGINEDFSLFVQIPYGAGIEEGSDWAISDTGDMAWITLSKQSKKIPDLVFVRGNGSIAVSAFQDDNYNGQRGKYELSVAGILVEVLDASDNVIATATTELKEVIIPNIPEGQYRLRFDTQEQYLYTKLGAAVNAINSITDSSNSSVNISIPIDVRSGETTSVASALYITSSIEGRVWLDDNNNGVMDDGEPGFENITITAKSKTNGEVYEATVAEDGAWIITQLPQDSYMLSAELPEDHLFAIYSLEGRDLRSIFTPYTGQKDSREYRLKNAEKLKNINIGVVKPASVQVKAFFDQNHNGIQEENEIGVSGITIEIIRDTTNKSISKGVTDENGIYSVPALRQNTYRIRAVLPQDGSEFSAVGAGEVSEVNRFANVTGRRESSVSPVMIANQQQNNILVGVARMLNFGGRVYVDGNFNGIYDEGEKLMPNVSVRVINAEEVEVYRTKTDAKGAYRIPNLYEGAVKLEFAAVKDYMYVRRLAHQNDYENYISDTKSGIGHTDFINLVMGEDNENVDAGLILSGSISGRIFNDLNDNGLDDDQQGFEGVAVSLLDENGAVLLSSSSDSEGYYFFEGILPGTYQLSYTLPEGKLYAAYDPNGNTFDSNDASYKSELISFRAGDKFQAKLGGVVELASLHGKAFVDSNANGILDVGEQVMSGLRLQLNSANQKMQSMQFQIEKNGGYEFHGLRPGSYDFSVELPQGYIFSNNSRQFGRAGQDTVRIEQADLLLDNLINLPVIKPASLHSSVWLDEDLNGTKGNDDGAYANASFYVEYNGEAFGTFQADENGVLALDNLRPGKYRIGLVLIDGAKPAKGFEQGYLGAYPTILKEFDIRESQNIEDKGYGVVVLMRIQGKLWIEDAGEAKPQAGIEINLYNQDGKQATTTSNEQGEYVFSQLNPGEYYIITNSMPGSIFVRAGDPNFETQNNSTAKIDGDKAVSKTLTLKMPQSHSDVNVIGIIPAVIGDMVWFDRNTNGLQDHGEPVMQNINITLVQDGEEKYRATSDGNGFYTITDIYPGSYYLMVTLPNEFAPTESVSHLQQISSVLEQMNGNQASSALFELKSGDRKYYYDIGFVWKEGYENSNYDFGTPATQDWSNQMNYMNEGWGKR